MTDARKLQGNIVEEIVASLHEGEGVLIERGKLFPSRSNLGRLREIDVLLTTMASGYPIRMAFECKNYGRKISSTTVDQFVGKLLDVGIPPQHGILVGTDAGFTRGAIDQAKFQQIRTLILAGLDSQRIAAAILQSVQTNIFLLLCINRVSINTEVEVNSNSVSLFLQDKRGKLKGNIADLVWADWHDGPLPEELGNYQTTIEIPSGWQWNFGGQDVRAHATVNFSILALVVSKKGDARTFTLSDATTGKMRKLSINAKFSENPDPPVVTTVFREADLEPAINRSSAVNLTLGRVRLPRVLFGIYWPPSERVISMQFARAAELIRQRILPENDPSPPTFFQLEGTNLAALWEPIWSKHPAAQDHSWPWPRGRRRRSEVSRLPDTVRVTTESD